ncbi:MAG: hypothetical protein HGA45_07465 [Chloroflexales bacterium]|nr:hypothetical protein [Chloroflexales bacterium]
MTIPSQQSDVTTFEQLIFQVRGIQAARVVTDQNGAIDEVHVVSLPGRSAKQIVRDIESILYVRGGVRLDHRKVSLVQLAEDLEQPQGARMLLLEVSRSAPQVAVTLGLRGRRARGVSVGDDYTDSGPLVPAAQATLSAIAQLIGAQADLRVAAVAEHAFGDLPVCLSQVTIARDGNLETLLGISMVRDDPARAAACAVLDAVNRTLMRPLVEPA